MTKIKKIEDSRPRVGINKLEIYTDGGARGNPGPAGIGAHALADSDHLFDLSEYIGNTTNNVAEYTATIKALEHLTKTKVRFTNLDFFLDSQLVVKQVNGEYKVKLPHLQLLHQQIISLCELLISQNPNSKINFHYIPREQNKIADSLVNQALNSL